MFHSVFSAGMGGGGEKEFLQEVGIMKKLIHPKVVQLYGVCTKEDPYYIVCEFMQFGDLRSYIRHGNF